MEHVNPEDILHYRTSCIIVQWKKHEMMPSSCQTNLNQYESYGNVYVALDYTGFRSCMHLYSDLWNRWMLLPSLLIIIYTELFCFIVRTWNILHQSDCNKQWHNFSSHFYLFYLKQFQIWYEYKYNYIYCDIIGDYKVGS